MILVIHNRTPGLIDNRTKQPVPTDEPVAVVASPYWRQRIRQSHVELVGEFSSVAEFDRQRAAADERAAAPSPEPPKPAASKPRGKRKRKPAPTLELDAPPPSNDTEKE